ncbi:thioredoxin-like domain-containing protein [Maribacter chungangensis]|uniref:Thioredoxin-like domain-containing protein n=1 Tax=Maribacter chungangensis TaxID=1069117 RepID=A0ABW3B623_9FLAO
MKYLFNITFILCICLISCKKERKESNGFVLHGNIKGKIDDYIYLEYGGKLDSSLVKSNTFLFNGNVAYPTKATILPASPTSGKDMTVGSFMIENSSIKIYTKYNLGNHNGKLLYSLDIDSLIGSNSNTNKVGFDKYIQKIINSDKSVNQKELLLITKIEDFIRTNPTSELSGDYVLDLSNFYGLFNSNQLSELLNMMDKNYQNEETLSKISLLINQRRVLDIGNAAPPFELPSLDNRLVTKEQFFGKYLLIEIWASWCAPCRQANPALLKTYNSYKNRNFEILGISLDKDLKQWQQAIKQDSINWLHVIDTAKTTQLTFKYPTIPFNILVDKEGKIIARNVTPEKLSEILNRLLQTN